MPTGPIPFMRKQASAAAAVEEVHIVWMTAGLGCDGDSVSVTNAEQPSIEDVLLGAIRERPQPGRSSPSFHPDTKPFA